MKKIPCVFQRDFVPRKNGRGSEAILKPDFTPGLERVMSEGTATIKFDGTACAVIAGPGDGTHMTWVPLHLRSNMFLHKRYDAKRGKPAPAGGIPCDEPDEKTGHWPHWVLVLDGPEDKWAREAYLRLGKPLDVGTYELCGPHLQGNPHGFAEDQFIKHGSVEILADKFERTFEGMRAFLSRVPMEGIVFWLDGEPRAKIRRKDFGFDWPPFKEGCTHHISPEER
jgi:hypothetical protein